MRRELKNNFSGIFGYEELVFWLGRGEQLSIHTYISDICVMRRPCVGQRLLATLRIPLPYLDPMIRRCGQDSGTREVDMDDRDTICMARFELFSFDHGEERD